MKLLVKPRCCAQLSGLMSVYVGSVFVANVVRAPICTLGNALYIVYPPTSIPLTMHICLPSRQQQRCDGDNKNAPGCLPAYPPRRQRPKGYPNQSALRCSLDFVDVALALHPWNIFTHVLWVQCFKDQVMRSLSAQILSILLEYANASSRWLPDVN